MNLEIKVNNKCLQIGKADIKNVNQSSLVLIGDTDVMECKSVFDTPKDSLIISKQVPIRPPIQDSEIIP